MSEFDAKQGKKKHRERRRKHKAEGASEEGIMSYNGIIITCN